ncbi:hypothetical protein BH23ACT2_BH23ACT2_14680 [soil metagenome]
MPSAPVHDLPVLDDPAVAADHVLGEGARAPLDAALKWAGATVEGSKPVQTIYYPGRLLTVRHEVATRWGNGRRSTESLVLSSGRRPPKGALVMSDDRHEIVVWRVPHDPWLPGLAPVLDPSRVAPVLASVGLVGAGLRCRMRSYRPGRRAVVEVIGEGLRALCKVVPPHAVENLQRPPRPPRRPRARALLARLVGRPRRDRVACCAGSHPASEPRSRSRPPRSGSPPGRARQPPRCRSGCRPHLRRRLACS